MTVINNKDYKTATATIYAPLHLIPRFSWQHSVILILGYIVAIIAVITLPITMFIKIILMVIVLIIAWLETSIHILRTSSLTIIEVIWDQNDNWTLKLISGKTLPATLLNDSVITSFLIILNFHISFLHWRSLILTHYNCDADSLRRLRVRLLLERSFNKQFN